MPEGEGDEQGGRRVGFTVIVTCRCLCYNCHTVTVSTVRYPVPVMLYIMYVTVVGIVAVYLLLQSDRIEIIIY